MNERSIFLEALEIESPDERAAFLDRACNGDKDLRKGVEGLLAANARSGTFMRPPAGGDVTADLRPSEGPGSRVGPYKLLQEIGEGGMGVVYMAEQEEPVRRKVALKIIKPGMDSKQVVARFEAERQALGMMDHPNIAKVFDAGTTDSGRPYFVMELVHGVPITEFCDANKLTPRERLELFVPVCQAIQHAHMKGVIHRDVKPSNVLVTMYDDKPVPKVIDFGVAKAVEQRLTEKTLFTQYGALVGTFEYMSPEQAEMNAFGVDTRSDVYSLGVLLYELLTGTTPLERQRLRTAAFGEVVRLIKEEEPPRPSLRISTSGTLAKVAAARKTEPGKLSGMVRGELDWIVMRCLEKDRTRRYDGAATLAKDVQRYLTGDAVEACPPTLGYRLKKAYLRNRATLTTAAVVAAALVAGTAVSAWQAVAASRAESAALAERDEKEKARLAEAEQRVAAETARQGMLAERDAANNAKTELRQSLYWSTMNLLPGLWQAEYRGRVAELLDTLRPRPGEPDLRGFEWHYWDRLARPERREIVLDKYQFPFRISPGGRFAVVVREAPRDATEFTLDLLEVATGRVKRTWTTTAGRPERFQVDEHGQRVAANHFSTDRSKREARLIVWNMANGEFLYDAPGPALPAYPRVLLSNNGRWLATIDGGIGRRTTMIPEDVSVTVRDLNAPREAARMIRLTGEQNDFRAAAFNHNSTQLAIITLTTPSFEERQGKAKLHHVDLTTSKVTLVGEFEAGAADVAFTPDGTQLVAVAARPEQSIAWDVRTPTAIKEIRRTPFETQAGRSIHTLGVTISPDSQTLAIGSAQVPNIHLLSVATGKLQHVIPTPAEPRTPPVFTADSQRVLAICNRGTTLPGFVLKEWDLPVPRTPQQGDASQLLPREAGLLLTTPKIASHDGSMTAEFDPRSGTITITERAGKRACVIQAIAKSNADAPGDQSKAFPSSLGLYMSLSPNGRFLQMSSPIQGAAAVYDSRTGAQVWDARRQAFDDILDYKITLSPDKRRLALAVSDGIRIVDFDTMADVTKLPVIGKSVCTFSPNGEQVVCIARRAKSKDETTREQMTLWDLHTTPARAVITHPTGPWKTEFSADGRWMVSLNQGDHHRVWNTSTGECVSTFRGLTNNSDVVIHPAGTCFVIFNRITLPNGDDVPQVIDATTGRIRFRLETGEHMIAATFSPDGNRIATLTRTKDKTSAVRLWHTVTGRELLTIPTQHNIDGMPALGFAPRPQLAFSPDGHRLTLTAESQGVVRTWDAPPRDPAKK